LETTLKDSLKIKTVRGLFWSFFELIGQQIIKFGIAVILARLLEPSEFGLIAMLAIFIDLAQLFTFGGFGQALIQKQNASYLDECSIFYFNLTIGCVAAGVLWLSAPWLALFYHKSILADLSRVLAFNVIINSFGFIQVVLLSKEVDFKTQTKVSLVAAVTSGTIGIVMAFNGFGVWSLVYQSLSNNVIRTGLLWIFHHWRPSLIFSFSSLRSLFTFGSKLLLTGLLDTIYQNIYYLVIGKFYSPTILGFYSRAAAIQQLPVDNISQSVSRVTYPVFSSMQDDKLRLKNGTRKALKTMAMLVFPLMIGMAVVSEPLVVVLFTDKWLPCVPYLKYLCAAGILFPLNMINLNVLKAQGRSDLFFGLEVVKKAMAIISIVITFRWVISAMIIGHIVTSILSFILNSHYTGKLLDYPFFEQFRDLLPVTILSCLMGVLVYAITFISIPGQLLLLIIQIIAGVLVYLLFCHYFQLSAFKDIMRIAKPSLIKYFQRIELPY
jgi:O-antigen/teichoic acid export membrane protein